MTDVGHETSSTRACGHCAGEVDRVSAHSAHRRGASKARLLAGFGYTLESVQQLEEDIRRDHLEADVIAVRTGPYGTRYDIRAPLQTPSGRLLNIRTVWQIDEGMEVPRLITLYPD